MNSETAEHRLKRLKLRSWRRGIKEMDLILGKFADAQLKTLPPEDLDAYEELMELDDQTLYAMFGVKVADPPEHKNMLNRIRVFHNLPETQ